jgi:hypothetical protein
MSAINNPNQGVRMHQVKEVLEALCGGSEADFSPASSHIGMLEADECAWAAIRGYARGVHHAVVDTDLNAVYNSILEYGDLAVADELIRREWALVGIEENKGDL